MRKNNFGERNAASTSDAERGSGDDGGANGKRQTASRTKTAIARWQLIAHTTDSPTGASGKASHQVGNRDWMSHRRQLEVESLEKNGTKK